MTLHRQADNVFVFPREEERFLVEFSPIRWLKVRLPGGRLRLLAALPLLGALMTSCAVRVSEKRPVAPEQIRPAQAATKEQLVAAYGQQVAAVRSINAAVELMPVAGSTYSGLIEEYHDVSGFILAAQPEKIRVIGQAPVLAKNVFDMTSDGKVFRIFIPSKNKFLVGPTDLERPSDKPIENLRPQHILDAIFWPPLPANGQILFEEAEAAPERYYVLTVLRQAGAGLEIARKVWFNRTDLRVSRVQIYGPGGRFDSDITYSDWQPVPASAGNGTGTAAASGSGTIFPRSIHIRRPQQDYALTVSITRLTLNSEIADDRFTLDQPAGSELVRLETPAPERP